MTTPVSGVGSNPTTTAATSGSTATAGSMSALATQDQFMKLFIAQLQNQDPLSPQDSSAFLAQLAQMSQLEQATETNQRLQSLADSQSAANRASMTGMVGRSVTANASTIEVRDGSAPLTAAGPKLSVHTDVPAKQLELDIIDGSGHTVKSIDLGAPGAGDLVIDPNKVGVLPVGTYQLAVKGKASDGSAITGSAAVTGIVDALQMGDTGNRFRIGPFNVSPANVTSVGASSP